MGFLNTLANHLQKNILGIKEKSLLGNVSLEIVTEKSITTTITVTNRRVEKGFNISDTARKEPLLFNITAVDNSYIRDFNRNTLKDMANAGEPISFYYAGRDLYENIVIESLQEIEDAILKNCFKYYIVLKQIDIAEIKAEDSKTDYKAAKSTGGTKRRSSASVKTPTVKETATVTNKVAEIAKEKKGKSAFRRLF